MTKQEGIIELIRDYMLNAIRTEVSGVDLDGVEPCIYYMNGNDGTDFDWDLNARTCEFFLFYKSTEMGFMKAYITSEQTLEGYWWEDEGRGKAHALHTEHCDIEGLCDISEVPEVLCNKFDENRIWDSPVMDVSFS